MMYTNVTITKTEAALGHNPCCEGVVPVELGGCLIGMMTFPGANCNLCRTPDNPLVGVPNWTGSVRQRSKSDLQRPKIAVQGLRMSRYGGNACKIPVAPPLTENDHRPTLQIQREKLKNLAASTTPNGEVAEALMWAGIASRICPFLPGDHSWKILSRP
ncbi:MAG: hypothetical protein HUU55_00845 [Myxococcales bacterium]|nr:hypothetical protein [Myxococcales bacterium]